MALICDITFGIKNIPKRYPITYAAEVNPANFSGEGKPISMAKSLIEVSIAFSTPTYKNIPSAPKSKWGN